MCETKLLILDLDGTINDSSPGISYCFRKTGVIFGKHDISDDALRDGLTGPFEENIKKILDLEDSQIPKAIEYYVDFYVKEGQSMSQIFPGMEETLHYLKDRGYALGLATLMVEKFAKQTLHGYGVDGLFDTIHGASLTIPYSKYDLINLCLESTGIEPSKTVMIGDGEDDHIAAEKAGVRFVGVTYGYGVDREYCTKNNVPYIDDPKDLRKLF